MEKEQFIETIAAAAKKHAPKYGIKVISPVIAQACLESGYGTSSKAARHNYFGLKYRKDRVQCHSGYFKDGSQEQNKDGSYVPISTDWYAFESLDAGVEGYFQFINTANYSNLKGVTDPFKYLQLIKDDGYATSLEYVANVSAVLRKWELQQYDVGLEGVVTVGYSNSPLISFTKLSPNHSGQRTHKIDRITPHCVVGQLSCERIADCFPQGRNASCQYGVGYDGRKSLIVEEKNRSWCTSSAANDQRAITIEVASDKVAPYGFTNEAYKGLVELCIDICKRNGFRKLIWFGDKNKSLAYEPADGECVLTAHRWFAAKSCPGDWMYAMMPDLADRVNKAIGAAEPGPLLPGPGKTTETLYRVQCGAFSKQNNATRLLNDLKAKGWNGFVTQVGNMYKVQLGAYTVKANAETLVSKIKASGFDAFVTVVERAAEAFVPREGGKTVDEIAKEIWTGKCSDGRYDSWGTGEVRKQRLESAGYNYDEVQAAIKRLYK